MHDAIDFLFPPMSYPVWWVIGAAVLVLLVIGWIVGVIVWTLPIEVLRRIPVIRDISYKVLRFKFSRSLTKVEQLHHEGQLSTRQAFHEISRIFRNFIDFRTGFQARRMTATDVAHSPLAGPALNVLAMTYPGQFDDADPRSVPVVVEAARTAVLTWA
ncbi:hypothetical protein [Mycolicibacterium neworleansense]|uniref:Transmembrane protein n=1 Tax=Mycolicibacterium neworleansense TaxID=146018 RepID=A0A0H5RSI4_9MYCO|nr:hypothetical protein [Mycolicibacterium neworleansense]MCV7361530.1 hypothetical protein [Mycolicibacterium neworleansense]CRZ16883.1 hypothetical protein BN2156_03761 [Mycolicibacterium neworleansense]